MSTEAVRQALDGVPVVPPGDPDALVASLRAAFGQGSDMNPAHIIRESLTNGDWGLGHTFSDIGPSFAVAADALFSEGFGLSLLWQRESTIEDFIADVLKHIDAYLYVDRRSGRWELRLIRADYDPDEMPDNLRRAHERNDEVLERIYIGRRFKNDTERLEKLFDLYTKMTAGAARKPPAKKAARGRKGGQKA